MNTHVPEPHVAASGGLPQGLAYSGGPTEGPVGALHAVAPTPQIATPGRSKQRVFGLVPAAPGSVHPMIVREARARIDPADVSKTRAALRAAQAQERVREGALIAAAGVNLGGMGTPAGVAAGKALQEVHDLAAALQRKLSEMTLMSTSRPISVTLAPVREPAEVQDAIRDVETRVVCMHDGCKAERWPDEASMRRAHPTDNEMKRAQQCHVFAVLCDSPLDPLDPDGERIGYVAPRGSDGTTIQTVIEAAPVASADRVAELEETVRALMAQMAEMARGLAAKK
jgi:hypothetical protein